MRFCYIVILLGIVLLGCKKNDPNPSPNSSTSTSNNQSLDNQYYYIKFYLNGDSSITHYDPYQISHTSNSFGVNSITIDKISTITGYQLSELYVKVPNEDSLVDTLALRNSVHNGYVIDSVESQADKFGFYFSLYNPVNNSNILPLSRQTSNVYNHNITSVKYEGFNVNGSNGYTYTVFGNATLLMYNQTTPTQTFTVTVKYKVQVWFP